MSNFQPLEVVDRGSETQPQVVENARVIKKMLQIATIDRISPATTNGLFKYHWWLPLYL